MKTLLTILVAFAAYCSASAQNYIFDKGVIALAGSVGYTSESANSITISTVEFGPQVGYFVIPNLQVGLSMNITSVSVGGASASSTGILPGVAYYFTNGKPVLTPFVGGGIQFSSGTNTSSRTDIVVIGGLAYVVSKNITIEPSLRFQTGGGSTLIRLKVGVGAYIW